MNAHMRGWFLATSSINLAGSGVLMLRYGAYGLLMKMHLWLIEKRTQSTHQYLAFDCAIILSSTCFIIWISGYCVLHCIWIALKFFLMFVWIMDIVIDPHKWPIMSSFSWSFYVVFQMLYGPFISSISFAHLLHWRNITDKLFISKTRMTTAQPWCDGHSTSISACGVWGVRDVVRVFRKELYTHIHLD